VCVALFYVPILGNQCTVPGFSVTIPLKKSEEFLCTKIILLEGVEQPKKSPKPPGNALSDALLMSRFQNFAADAANNYHCTPRCFFEISLRAVLINESIRMNSQQKILKSSFLHCTILRYK